MTLIADIDAGALAETAAASLVAGIALTLAFSLAIVGLTRAGELRGEGRSVAANIAALLGLLALVVALTAVGLGLVLVIAD